ncbi:MULTISPECIES: hypothetical protein [unclassified Kitasatospora]|uniref:hypothetical protein n=1 Tax=unclassified Kitasatospora TaxID=2633591 RepID=UPI0033C83321
MTGVELVMAALAAGASAGLTDTANSAVREAYDGLRGAVRRRLSAHGEEVLDAEQVEQVEQVEQEVWEARLHEQLTASGADSDRELLAAAQALLALVGPADDRRIDLSHAQGVQVGNHSTQTNHFN